MGTPPRKNQIKSGDDGGLRGSAKGDALSPLPRSQWDSPPGSVNSNRSTPSSQRKLFGRGNENVENEKHKGKKICKKGRSKEKDVKPSVTFPDFFSAAGPPEKSISRMSLLQGPRLRQRQAPVPEGEAMPVGAGGNKKPQSLTIRSPPRLDPTSPPKRKLVKPRLSPRKDPRKDPVSPLFPQKPHANSDLDFSDFTMTPTILYHGNGQGQGLYSHHLRAPTSSSSQHYCKSPHWSGQVNVNPFSPIPEQYLRPPTSTMSDHSWSDTRGQYSPIPEQYLRPPTSTKSVTRGDSRKQRPGGYDFINLAPPMLPTNPHEPHLVPRKKKARLNPLRGTRAMPRSASATLPVLEDSDEIFTEISPTDVTQGGDAFDAKMSGNKRKAEVLAKPPPQSMDAGVWPTESNKRMRIKRGRYLDDFEEVQFLGAGSFGSVNACLSRLDGCMYAIKSVSPSGQVKKGVNCAGTAGIDGIDYLYGGRKMMSNQCAIPPTPRRDMAITPLPRKKTRSRFGMGTDESNMADDSFDPVVSEGSSHWNDGALRRVLREVFALAALCQQDDFRTFHIVRYHQAWLEDDGTLYIQTELCSATLRDEMAGKGVIDSSGIALQTSQTGPSISTGKSLDFFRQIKVLREVLLALEFVHQQGMVHLDIKPENVFVKNDLFKLGDFGLANVFTKNGGKDAAAPDIEEGDSRYMSKDLLDFVPKDVTKCDIFSLGATMYEIISGKPLPACGQEWQDLRNGKLPALPGAMPCLYAIIREMMHPDPDKRPTASDLLSREALSCDSNPLSQKSSLYKVPPSKGNDVGRSLKRSHSWSL